MLTIIALLLTFWWFVFICSIDKVDRAYKIEWGTKPIDPALRITILVTFPIWWVLMYFKGWWPGHANLWEETKVLVFKGRHVKPSDVL